MLSGDATQAATLAEQNLSFKACWIKLKVDDLKNILRRRG